MDVDTRTKADVLASLRREVQQLQGYKQEACKDIIHFGVPSLDEAFPNGSFETGAVHEFICKGRKMAPALGFMAGVMSLIAKEDGLVLWVTKSRNVFPPGLAIFGLRPHRIVFISVRNDKEALWTLEEGLRCDGLSVAVAEISDADLTATKRLQLATEQSGVTGFLVRTNPTSETSSACFSSWRIRSCLSHLENGLPGVGYPRWHVELRKVRNGRPGSWMVEWRAGAFKIIEDAAENIARWGIHLAGVA